MATPENAEQRPPTRQKDRRRGNKRQAARKGIRMLRLPLRRGGSELLSMASVAGVHTALAVRVDRQLLGFDAGFNLEHLSRAQHLFLSHGHVDHAGALPLIVSRRELVGIKKPPVVYAPESCVAPIEALLEAYRSLSGVSLSCRVQGVRHGEVVRLPGGVEVEVVGMEHRVPTVGFVVWKASRRLRAEFQGLSSEEIKALRAEGTAVVEQTRVAEFAYSGDTVAASVLGSPSMLAANLLVCECTYVPDAPGAEAAKETAERARARGHVGGADAGRIVEASRGAVVFMHFSARHSVAAIQRGLGHVVPEREGHRVWAWSGPK